MIPTRIICTHRSRNIGAKNIPTAQSSTLTAQKMDQGLILLLAALMVFVAPAVQGTAHLSFANDTQVNITRTGCGVTKLCVETPDNCDPAGNSSCLFASVNASSPMPPNGTELSVELRGYSMGYVAMGLTANASEGTTMLYVCASNNGSFSFQTIQRNNTNDELTAVERIVTEIRGTVDGNVIKCEFNIPSVNATSTRDASSTTFVILLGTGSVNGTTIGPFNVTLNSGALNVANPASNIAPTTPPTATNTTMSSSGAIQPHAVLLLLSVLTLFVLLKA